MAECCLHLILPTRRHLPLQVLEFYALPMSLRLPIKLMRQPASQCAASMLSLLAMIACSFGSAARVDFTQWLVACC